MRITMNIVFDPNVLLYSVVIVLYVALRPVYTRLIRKLVSLTKSDLDDKIYTALEKPLWFAVLLGLIDLLLAYLIPNQALHGVILSGLVALIVISLLRVGKVIIFELIGVGSFLNVDERLKQTALNVIYNVYVAIVLFFGFMYFLGVWNIDITPILASAGIFGFVIGLALKDPLQNLISGILLLTDPPFRVGDAVKIGDIAGTVKEIGLRNTKILTFNGEYVTIPNNTILNSVVVNYNMPDEKVRTVMQVGASYDAEPKKVMSVLKEILSSHPKVLKEPEPVVLLVDFGDSDVVYEIRYWTMLSDKLSTASEIREAILKRFEEEGIDIPYPITTVYLHSAQ